MILYISCMDGMPIYDTCCSMYIALLIMIVPRDAKIPYVLRRLMGSRSELRTEFPNRGTL